MKVEAVEAVAAESGFAGVVRVDRGDEVVLERAFGLAHRGYGVPLTVTTRLGMASGSKALTALVVLSLAADGALPLDTPARDLLGSDLPEVGPGVTVELLLAHRSGIGDHVDETLGGEIDDHVVPVPVHTLVDAEDHLRLLHGLPPAFAPGARFAYCNGGYVLLAALAQRATGVPFAELVAARVTGPAAMTSTAFLRSDDLPGDAAVGYLGPTGDRTNVLHLPVVGGGDGGAYTTAADVHRLWAALHTDQVLPRPWVERAWSPTADVPEEGMRYGLGFWLHPTEPVVALEGYDAGVSFRSVHDPRRDLTMTILGGWSDAAWPLARHLGAELFAWPR